MNEMLYPSPRQEESAGSPGQKHSGEKGVQDMDGNGWSWDVGQHLFVPGGEAGGQIPLVLNVMAKEGK